MKRKGDDTKRMGNEEEKKLELPQDHGKEQADMTEVIENKSCRSTSEIRAGKDGKVYVDLTINNIEEEKAEEIRSEIERAKDNIKKILAGNTDKESN